MRAVLFIGPAMSALGAILAIAGEVGHPTTQLYAGFTLCWIVIASVWIERATRHE